MGESSKASMKRRRLDTNELTIKERLKDELCLTCIHTLKREGKR